MHRRRFLARTATAAAATASTPLPEPSVAAETTTDPPGVAWVRTYDDLAIGSVAPAHGGGHVVVNRGEFPNDPDRPVRVAVLDDRGVVQQRRELSPDVPEDARYAGADVVRTADGYAVASGTWFARLEPDLSVKATGFASEFPSNKATRVTGLGDGVAIASDGTGSHDRRRTRVLGFDADGTHRWTWEYGGLDLNDVGTTALRFLLDGPDGGLVVGGYRLGTGHPWLAGLGGDGTERWKVTLADVPAGVGAAATTVDGGVTLFGEASMVRLDASRSVAWQRTYVPTWGHYDVGILPAKGGGYVVAAGVGTDRVQVGRADATGRFQWRDRYAVDYGWGLRGFVKYAPGEYLVVGAGPDDRQGWAVLLSEWLPSDTTPTPTPTPTPTATPTPTPTPSPTPSPTPTATPSRTPPPSETDTGTTAPIPGFGVWAALAGLGAGWLARRR